MTRSESLPEFQVLESARTAGRRGQPGDPVQEASADRVPVASVRPAAPGPAVRRAADDIRSGAVQDREPDVVAVLDERGRFVFVTDSAERLFGADVADVAGRDVFALFDPVDAEHVRGLFEDLVAGRRTTVSLGLRATRADGRVLDLHAVAVSDVGGVVVNLGEVGGPARAGLRPPVEDGRGSTVVESLADGVMVLDAVGTIVGVNESFEVMFGSPRVRILGRRFEDVMAGARSLGFGLVDAEGREIDVGGLPLEVALRSGRRVAGVVVGLLRRGMEPIWFRTGARAMLDHDGAVTGVVGSFSELTVATLSPAELRREEQFLQVLLDTLDEGIIACDAEGRITVFNPSARRLHGLPEGAEPIGEIPTDRGFLRGDGSPMAPQEHPLIRAMSGERVRDVEVVLESEAGGHRKVSVNGQALVDEGGWMLGAVVAMHDVTEQRMNEERLAELALHDPLTALANRTLLASRLREAIARMGSRSRHEAGGPQGTEPGAPGGQSGLAILLLDLDDFKEVNDQLGHDVGDDTLVAVARRLMSVVRPADTVARLGGDEFVVVCEIEHGEDEMVRITERISTALARPYRVDGRTLTVTASVGGVFVDNPDTDPSKLLSRADDAMYGVKWARRRQRRLPPD